MSLLSSYEGLQQEIQRLAQENQELRRLVQLIQENEQLKLVLRNRGIGLSCCSSGLLAEVPASPRLPRRRTINFRDAERGAWARAVGVSSGTRRLHSPSRAGQREVGEIPAPVQPCSVRC
nr:speriolin-like [Delphinus delphis]